VFRVIASEAKQSRFKNAILDCFVASLLAMTITTPAGGYGSRIALIHSLIRDDGDS